MSVLDTFYLLFDTNALKARDQVAQLDKKIADLTTTGRKRSDQENKDLKELKQRQKELKEEISDTTSQTDKLVDSAARLVATYASFQFIKSGVVNTANFNRALEVQSKNLGQNADKMLAYSAAVEKAGGSQQAFLSYVEGKTRSAAGIGLPFDFVSHMRGIRQFIDGMSPTGKLGALDALGISDPGMVAMLMSTNDEFDKMIRNMEEIARASEKSRASSKEWGESVDELNQAWKSYWSTVNEQILPVLSQLNKNTTAFLQMVSKDGTAATDVFTLMAGAVGLLASHLTRVVTLIAFIPTAFWDIGKAGAAVFDPSLRDESAIGRWSQKFSNYLTGVPNTYPSAPGGRSGDTGGDDMAYWIGKGYTREQAAVIMSTIKHESAGNPGAVGDSGAAIGLVQWHEDRRRQIQVGTGIDISNSTYEQQRDALAWEMKNIKRAGWDDDKFRSMNGIGELSSYYTDKYITPRDIAGQSFARANTAIGIANQYTPAQGFMEGDTNKSMSVKIDNVNVQTQATDAQGIGNDIAQNLSSSFRKVAAEIDNGVDR